MILQSGELRWLVGEESQSLSCHGGRKGRPGPINPAKDDGLTQDRERGLRMKRSCRLELSRELRVEEEACTKVEFNARR